MLITRVNQTEGIGILPSGYILRAGYVLKINSSAITMYVGPFKTDRIFWIKSDRLHIRVKAGRKIDG